MTSFDGGTNRAREPGTAEQTACPALGLAKDRTTHFVLTSDEHRCFAAPVTRKIPLEHQSRFCLMATYRRCPLWLHSSMNPDAPENPPPLPHAMPPQAQRQAHRRLPAIHLPRPRLPRPSPGRLAAVLAACAVLAAVIGVAVALSGRSSGANKAGSAGRSGVNRAGITGAAAAPGAASTPAAAPSNAGGGRAPATAASATPAAAALSDQQVLRPGATVVKRLNLSLDGTPTGNIAVASRVSSPGGCDRWFLDIYAFDKDAGRFVDRFDGTAANQPAASDAAPLLTAPEQGDSGCFPRLDLLESRTFESMSRPLLIATIALPDKRTRLLAIGVPPGGNGPRVLYDLTPGASATVRMLDGPSRVEVSESAFAPAIPGIAGPETGPVGTFQQVLGGSNGGFGVLARSLVPACSSGTVAGKNQLAGERWLSLRCAGGNGEAVFVLARGAGLVPAKGSFDRVQIGDTVSVSLDGAVRPPGDAVNAAAEISGLTILS